MTSLSTKNSRLLERSYKNLLREIRRGNTYAAEILVDSLIQRYDRSDIVYEKERPSVLRLIYNPMHHRLLFERPQIITNVVASRSNHKSAPDSSGDSESFTPKPCPASIELWKALSALQHKLLEINSSPLYAGPLDFRHLSAQIQQTINLMRNVQSSAQSLRSGSQHPAEQEQLDAYVETYKVLIKWAENISTGEPFPNTSGIGFVVTSFPLADLRTLFTCLNDKYATVAYRDRAKVAEKVSHLTGLLIEQGIITFMLRVWWQEEFQ